MRAATSTLRRGIGPLSKLEQPVYVLLPVNPAVFGQLSHVLVHMCLYDSRLLLHESAQMTHGCRCCDPACSMSAHMLMRAIGHSQGPNGLCRRLSADIDACPDSQAGGPPIPRCRHTATAQRASRPKHTTAVRQDRASIPAAYPPTSCAASPYLKFVCAEGMMLLNIVCWVPC